MKIRTSASSQRGFTLLECIVYMALLMVIVMLSFECYERVQENSEKLRRNADEIVNSLKAGERWRREIRSATAEIKIENDTIHIPWAAHEIAYAYQGGMLMRRGPGDARWRPILSNVKSSQMFKDAGTNVTSWRWELELKTREKSPRAKPMFTFQAVPTFQEK